MKIIAYTRVHYGADYLRDVIRSTEGFAEKHVLLYTPHTSAGFGSTNIPNPDSYHVLRNIASESGYRVEWREKMAMDMRSVTALYPDADIVLGLDADEVIAPELFQAIIDAVKSGELTKHMYRLPMIHFWRSFGYVCEDSNHPVRLYLPKNKNDETDYFPNGNGVIYHMGYARTVKDTDYKVRVSAHLREFRPEWWNEIFMKFPERLEDLHPVCLHGFWNAKPFDRSTLPEFMHKHEYFELEVIE